ncbi:MAG: patatin-like phospholipase family protein [Sandaracinaceae bacterium]
MGSPRKRILYWGPDYACFEGLVRSIAGSRPTPVVEEGLELSHPRAEITFCPSFNARTVLARLDERFVHLLVLDLRCPNGAALDDRIAAARELVRALDDVDDMEARYGFHRILVLVGGADEERIDRLLVELGGYGIRHVHKDRGGDAAFGPAVLERALSLMLDREPARTALCAAGGGITGIFFELGAFKCLEDCLGDGAIHDFDMYFGISAGAVVTSVIANGFSADEMMAALAGAEGGRIPPLDFSLLKLGHLNLPDYARRAGELVGKALSSLSDLAAGRGRPTLDGAFLELTAAAGAPFRSDRYEEMLRAILESPGATNRFDELPKELYIGASNQDSRQHVLFGPGGETPISRAVQASLSINPAFSGVEIDGVWYEDGAVTRTSNFTEAIHRGAGLVLVVDPFVPYVSQRPGFANRRGMLFNIDQDVRCLSYTRFENARQWALRRHPEVSSYTFLPNNRLRRELSVNPMDHRPFLSIFKGAYLGTLRRILQIEHRLRGDLAVQGIELRTERAQAIAERLEATTTPRLEDFFVDGRLDIRTPPLARSRRAVARGATTAVRA